MATPQQQEDPRVGSIIGAKWRVDALLGSGSMASVYAVTHRNGSRAALKILHESLASDVSVCERFLGEGYLTNSIKSPGIVRVFDDGMTDDGCPFLAMDLLEGETLDLRRTNAGGKLPMFEVIDIADKVMETLAAVHQAGIIHRDLKPQNVFCENDGGIRLLDFGVARLQERINSHSVVGMVLGTPSFMSPEQALGGKDVDARSDIWALGAIMFTLLTGETVHVAATIQARLLAAASVRARSVLSAAPQLPQDIALVIDTALQFKKEERWQTVTAMRSALRNVKQSLPPPEMADSAIDAIRQASLRPNVPGPSGGLQERGPQGLPDRDGPASMNSPSGLFTSAPPIERVTVDKKQPLRTMIGVGGQSPAFSQPIPPPPGYVGPVQGSAQGSGPYPANGSLPSAPNTARGLGSDPRPDQGPLGMGQFGQTGFAQGTPGQGQRPVSIPPPPDPHRVPYESLVSAAESANVPAVFGNTNAVWAQVPTEDDPQVGRNRRVKVAVSIAAMLAAALIAFAAVALIKKSTDARHPPTSPSSPSTSGPSNAPSARGAGGDPTDLGSLPYLPSSLVDGGRGTSGAPPLTGPQGQVPQTPQGAGGDGTTALGPNGAGIAAAHLDGGASPADAGPANNGASTDGDAGSTIELW